MIYALYWRYAHQFAIEVETIVSAVSVLEFEEEMMAEGIYDFENDMGYTSDGELIGKGVFKEFFDQSYKL